MRHQKGSLLLQTVSWPSPRLEDTPAHTEHWCLRHASANHPTLTNQRHPHPWEVTSGVFLAWLALSYSPFLVCLVYLTPTHPSMPSSGVIVPNKPSLTAFPVNGPNLSLYMKYCLHVFLVPQPEWELLKSRDGLGLGLTHL